jgi:predicted nucleic-acid-binding Zn-ribbon protein
MVKEQRVVPMQSNLFCDDCGYRMTFDGIATATIPAKFKHSCTNCGYTDFYTKIYPAIEYIEEDAIDTYEFDDVLGVNNEDRVQ